MTQPNLHAAAIVFHVDSLNEAYGFPRDYDDPTYTIVIDRFLALAKKFGFKATFFVIGRDLLIEKNRARVLQLANQGHEIANHSYHHHLNFGFLAKKEMLSEMYKTDALIKEITGHSAVGFAAPNWSSSSASLQAVKEAGYKYDASLFPSWLRYPAAIKTFFHCLQARNGRCLSLLQQKHLGYALVGNRRARQVNGLTCMPVPTNQWRLACWHTLVFMFGQRLHEMILRSCLKDNPHFYYVIHPADLLDMQDLNLQKTTHLARLQRPLKEKIALLERSLEIIASRRKFVTLATLAKQVM